MGCCHMIGDAQPALKKLRKQLRDSQIGVLSINLSALDKLFSQAKKSIKSLKLAKENFIKSSHLSSVSRSFEKNLLEMLAVYNENGKMIEFISTPPYFKVNSSSDIYNNYKIFVSELTDCRNILFDALTTMQSYLKKNLREIISTDEITHAAEANWAQIKKHFGEKHEKLFRVYNIISEDIGIIKRISVKLTLLNANVDPQANESDLNITQTEFTMDSRKNSSY